MRANGIDFYCERRENYLGHVDTTVYTPGDLKRMGQVHISLGIWSSAWITAANAAFAKEGGFQTNWIKAAHYPHVTCPRELAAYIRDVTRSCIES